MKNIIKKAISALTAAVVAATSLAASFGFSASAAVNDTAEIYYNTRFVSPSDVDSAKVSADLFYRMAARCVNDN